MEMQTVPWWKIMGMSWECRPNEKIENTSPFRTCFGNINTKKDAWWQWNVQQPKRKCTSLSCQG